MTRGAPTREARAVLHALRQPLVVEPGDAGFADVEIAFAQPRLGLEHGAQNLAVAREKRRLVGLEAHLIGRERLGNEQPPRLFRLDAAVVDAPLAGERQAEQRHDFARRHLAAFRIPLRIVVDEPHEMRRDAQRPARVDLRHGAQVLALRRDALGGHEPARPLLGERRAGEQLRARLAHAAVDEPVLVLGDEIDERREHGLVNRAVVGRLLARAPAQRLHELMQLIVHVVPLAQARRRKVMLLAPGAQRALAVAPLAPVRRPEVQITRELRARVGEHLVLAARGVGIHAVLARIDDAQGGRDHEPFAQRIVAVRDDEQPRHARIDRQPRHDLPVLREAPLVVDGAEQVQELIGVGHRLRRRRVDERELVDGAEPQRFEPQQHAREPGAQDLGLRERGPRREVLLGVEPHADAGRETAAAARPLDRVRLRDRLDTQALHAMPRAVAADAREPGIDDVADARHGQRRLGDVGREHDARRLAGLEDPPLPRRREARIERQQLVALRAEPRERVLGVADPALAGQEHEHVADRARVDAAPRRARASR